MGLPTSRLDALEQRLGHAFRNRALLEEAVSHPSVTSIEKGATTNQRLEFLGDAVIGLVFATKLFQELPEAREGELTRRRSELVRAETLAAAAEDLGIWEFIRFGPIREAERATGRQRALCDAFEALAGAVYLDAGFDTAQAAVRRWLGAFSVAVGVTSSEAMNPKGALQERLQPTHGNAAVRYEILESTGPDHRRHFTARVLVRGEEWGRGEGESKKAAEEAAARAALARPSP